MQINPKNSPTPPEPSQPAISWPLKGCFDSFLLRFRAWMTRQSVADELFKRIQNQEITPEQLRWFSHEQLQELGSKIRHENLETGADLKPLFEQAIYQTHDKVQQADLADLIITIDELATPESEVKPFIQEVVPYGEGQRFCINGEANGSYRTLSIGLLYNAVNSPETDGLKRLHSRMAEAVKTFQESTLKDTLENDLETLDSEISSLSSVEEVLERCMNPQFDALMNRLVRGISNEYLRANWDTLPAICKVHTVNEKPAGMTLDAFLRSHLTTDTTWALCHSLGIEFIWETVEHDTSLVISPPMPLVALFQVHLLESDNRLDLLSPTK